MKLPFGKYKNKLIHISEVQSGRTDLVCPNCRQSLIAKKGKLKEHHFAHDGESCTAVFSKKLFGLANRLPTKLPLCMYAQQKKEEIEKKLQELHTQQSDTEHQELLLEEFQIRLKKLTEYFQQQNNLSQARITKEILQQFEQFLTKKIAAFPSFHLLRDTVFKTGYTDGKVNISHDQLTIDLHEYYYPLVFQPYVECLQQYHSVKSLTTQKQQLQLYQKEFARFNQFQLYFLEIQLPSVTIYKIGLTARSIAVRLKEIQQELNTYFNGVSCKVLVLKKGVAFLENFFKRKYHPFQFSIGTLTEYFQFSPPLLDLILQDFVCIEIQDMPSRHAPIWPYWAFFNSNGKLYGGTTKHLFVNGEKYRLTSLEKEKLEQFLTLN